MVFLFMTYVGTISLISFDDAKVLRSFDKHKCFINFFLSLRHFIIINICSNVSAYSNKEK
jgi:hypothetical protein